MVACSVALGVLAWPLDGAVADLAASVWGSLGGDLRRAVGTLQQFGQGEVLAVVAVLIYFADPHRRGRVFDLGLAALLVWLVTDGIKAFVGRPRPKFEDPGILLGPWGAYPMPGANPPGVYHAWEVWEPISSDLWSMPSSHTALACVLAVWMGSVYPRLRWPATCLAVFVGCARVLVGAHYLSDVLVGAGLGLALGHAAVSGWWGVRGLDWAWHRFVDRDAPWRYDRLRKLGPPG